MAQKRRVSLFSIRSEHEVKKPNLLDTTLRFSPWLQDSPAATVAAAKDTLAARLGSHRGGQSLASYVLFSFSGLTGLTTSRAWLFQQYFYRKPQCIANRTACIADYLATYRTDRTDPYRKISQNTQALQSSLPTSSSPPARPAFQPPAPPTLQASTPLQPCSPAALQSSSSSGKRGLELEGWSWRAGGLKGWRAGRLELEGWRAGRGMAGVCAAGVGVVVVADIRDGVSLPNRTETPQYWQYIYR